MTPVDLSRHEKATPGPWGLSGKHTIHGKKDIVCEVTVGEWGDPYPVIEVSQDGTTARAVNKLIPYGCVSEEEAQANINLILDAYALREEVIHLRALVESLQKKFPEWGTHTGE